MSQTSTNSVKPALLVPQPNRVLDDLYRRLFAVNSNTCLEYIWKDLSEALDGGLAPLGVRGLVVVVRDFDTLDYQAQWLCRPDGLRSDPNPESTLPSLPAALCQSPLYGLTPDSVEGQHLLKIIGIPPLTHMLSHIGNLAADYRRITDDRDALLVFLLDRDARSIETLAMAAMLVFARLTLAAKASHLRRFAAYFSHAFKGASQQLLSTSEAFEEFCEKYRINRGLAGQLVREMYDAVDEMRGRLVQVERVAGIAGAEQVKQSIDFMACLQRCMRRFEKAAQNRGITLVLKEPVPELPRVLINERDLEIVLSNLLDNAVKYSYTGRRVDIALESHPTNEIGLTVASYGQGILKEEEEAIFHLFYRTRRPDPRRLVPGSGIGLYVTRRILEDYGGSIRAHSVRGNPPSGRHSDDPNLEGAYYLTLVQAGFPGENP